MDFFICRNDVTAELLEKRKKHIFCYNNYSADLAQGSEGPCMSNFTARSALKIFVVQPLLFGGSSAAGIPTPRKKERKGDGIKKCISMVPEVW